MGSNPSSRTIPYADNRRPSCFVYFVMSMETERVKIGMAADPIERLCALQTACPEELGLLGYIFTFNAKALEAALHAQFRRDHVRGEWFNITDELMDYIEAEACQDRDQLDMLTGRQTAWEEPARPQAIPKDQMPKGKGRKAILARYKLARGLPA